MNFKKPKQEVLNEIQARAQQAMQYELSGMHMMIDTNSFVWQLQTAISKGIAEGFKVMMENQYTDQEFEQDIGLKP